jgi:hypothetical protein
MSAAVVDGGAGGRGGVGLAPVGVPVRRGRLHLGRLRGWLPEGDRVAVVTGFATVCWLGAVGVEPPGLGRLVFRSVAGVDGRGRVVLDRRSRAWLAVPDPAGFEAVVVPVVWDCGGVLVVPVEGYARRIVAVTP